MDISAKIMYDSPSSLQKEKLYIIIKVLGFIEDGQIEECLKFYRDKYKEMPNPYPGDDNLFKMFYDNLASGLSINDSKDKTIKDILIEIEIKKTENAIGLGCFKAYPFY